MKKKYWYKIEIYYCPVCGKDSRYQERQYGPKPQDICDRYTEYERYDYCDAF